jgi:hypothetical protein
MQRHAHYDLRRSEAGSMSLWRKDLRCRLGRRIRPTLSTAMSAHCVSFETESVTLRPEAADRLESGSGNPVAGATIAIE